MKIILQGIVGSQAYGFSTPTSDVDRLGIFALPTEDFLGIDCPINDKARMTHCSTEPDVTMHEAYKACGLMLKCNHL